MRCAVVSLEERMKSEILLRLRQQSSGGATPVPSDLPRDASDVDLSRQYLDDLESRSVSGSVLTIAMTFKLKLLRTKIR